MISKDVDLPIDQKVRALRLIQSSLGPQAQPIARSCGLTEEEFLSLESEGLIQVRHFSDSGEVLDIHRIEEILPMGLAVLARANLMPSYPNNAGGREDAAPSLPIPSEKESKLAGYIWDLVKILLAGAVGIFGAWFAWKHKWK